MAKETIKQGNQLITECLENVVFPKLSDRHCTELAKVITLYVFTRMEPDSDNMSKVVQIVWLNIRDQLKRNLKSIESPRRKKGGSHE